MPLVFIHGVNNRAEDPAYQADLQMRGTLLRRLFLPRLAQGRYRDMAIVDVYWGDLGAAFAWGLRSVPGWTQTEAAPAGGAPAERTPLADAQMAALADSRRPARTADTGAEAAIVEGTGPAASLRDLAAADLPALVETLLAAISNDEWHLTLPQDQGAAPAQRAFSQGEREALLLVAGEEAAHDPQLSAALRAATSDDQALTLIKDAIGTRYRQLLLATEVAEIAAPPTPPAAPEVLDSGLESARTSRRWVADLGDQVDELLDRARGGPLRATVAGLLQGRRLGAHEQAARFLGDVFVYLQHRGDQAAPGPIVQRVLTAVQEAPRAHADEPLIVLTHSMGGNIFYDILTHFAPDLQVAAWVSIGGQVAQFEEVKLFKASQPGIRHPQQVPRPGTGLGAWLNIYDPADLFSFLAEPVFQGVRDLAYSTGSSLRGAHADYFKRASFYRLLAEQVGPAIED